MKSIIAYCILGISFFCFSSCVRDVILDAREKPTVVAVCILTDDPVQSLRLSFTKGASRSEAPPLTEATATLFDGEEKVGVFQKKQDNEWTLSYAAIPMHHYRLEIEVPGYDKIWAEQTMPEPAPLYSGFCNRYHGRVWPKLGWVFWSEGDTIFHQDWPEGEEYPPGESVFMLSGGNTTKSPFWLYGMNYNKETGEWETADMICADESVVAVDSINTTHQVYKPLTLDVPNPYMLWSSNIPRDQGYLLETFPAAHLLQLYPDLDGAPLHKGFLRMHTYADPNKNRKLLFYISGSFTGDYYKPAIRREESAYYWYYYHAEELAGLSRWGEPLDESGDKGYILCISPSEDYDKFLLEAYHYKQILASTDLSTIYLRDNIYSNIAGGIGLFGAAAKRRYPWLPTYTYADAGLSGYTGLVF